MKRDNRPLRNRPLNSAHISGQAALEFVVAISVFIPLALGTIQAALIATAQLTVQYAAYTAARTGIVHNGDREQMEQAARTVCAFIQQEVLFSSAQEFFQEGLPPRQGRVERARELPWISALAEVDRLSHFTRVEIVAPTKEAFLDFGQSGSIPFDAMESIEQGGPSETTLSEANLLTVKLIHYFPLFIPVANIMFFELFSLLEQTSPPLLDQDAPMFARYRVPLVGFATLRMQSDSAASLLGIEL